MPTIFFLWLIFFSDKIGSTIQDKLKEMTRQRTVPNVFIHGKHNGGADDTMKLHTDGELMGLIMLPSENYTYDLIVIGGGSGGLACSKVLSTYIQDIGIVMRCLPYLIL